MCSEDQTWIRCLQDWQTAIFALFGFAAVVSTLIINAWLARCERRAILEHEREVLTLGLKTELQLNLNELNEIFRAMPDARAKGQNLFANLTWHNSFYNSLLSRIPVLSANIVELVMKAEGNLLDFLKWLDLNGMHVA